jgi:hypothetical protein
MKILSLTIIASSKFIDATRISGEQIQHRMNKLDKLKLLKNSQRVVQGRNRKLDDNYQQQQYQNYQAKEEYQAKNQYYQNQHGQNSYNYNTNDDTNGDNNQGQYYNYDASDQGEADFEIDGSYAIKFDQCVSLGVLNDNIDQYNGQDLQSTEDYVIFKAVDHWGKSAEFATKISTFLDTMINTIPNDREKYCEACENYRETCEYKGYMEERNQNNNNSNMERYGQYAGQNEGNNRNLEDADESLIYVQCDTCTQYGCWDEYYSDQESNYKREYQGWDDYLSTGEDYITMENALEWLSGIGQCQEINMYVESNQYVQQQQRYSTTNSNQNYGKNENMRTYYEYQNNNPYAGLMCNKDGTGMEIGVFHDPDCTIYEKGFNFKSLMKKSSGTYQFYEMTKGLVEWVFTQPIDCMQVEYGYLTQEEEYAKGDSNYGYSQQQNGDVQTIETCQQLFQQEIVQIDVANCVDNGNDNANSNSYNAGGNGGNYVYYADDKQYGKKNFYREQYGWESYFYDMKDRDDMEQVCQAIQTKETLETLSSINSQSMSANMYNYKLYSAKVNWQQYKEHWGLYMEQSRENYQAWYNNKAVPTAQSSLNKLFESAQVVLFVIVGIMILLVASKLAPGCFQRLHHNQPFEDSTKTKKDICYDSSNSHSSDSLNDSTKAKPLVAPDIESYDFFPDQEQPNFLERRSRDPPLEPSKFENPRTQAYSEQAPPYEQPYQNLHPNIQPRHHQSYQAQPYQQTRQAYQQPQFYQR